ncbi:3-dehydroquinate synthase [bacterium]|nr:3-dehydroquinate synthase [bacterium]MBU1985179.1 3-dehydroquinate synthase [bacterium]
MNTAELFLRLGSHSIPVRHAQQGGEWAASEIRSAIARRETRILLVTDECVALHYEQEFRQALTAAGFDVSAFVLPTGELHKTLSQVSGILDTLAEERFARDDLVVGFGGGVVTDIAGFAAAIYRRGMPWIAVPTTLMGMVDAAIGGKTGMDHPLGKNLIGTFHQPLAVFAPMNVLTTLDPREWLSGSAEVVKCALISGGRLWQLVRSHGPDLGRWSKVEMHEAVRLAAAVKIEIVSQDERDLGVRRLLNLGHTFGHALEAVTGYSRLTHGEAVFYGLRSAVQMSARLGLLPEKTAAGIDEVLARAPVPAVCIEPEALTDALEHDKKTASGTLHWILLSDIGKLQITSEVSREIVNEAADRLCRIARAGVAGESTQIRKRILVINGPNLNLLGTRQPEAYGTRSYEELIRWLRNAAAERDAELLVRQSNIEGELVEIVQRARQWADGIIINPGGYTHTSVALRDAISGVDVPAVEVHLSDVAKREPFRQVSLVSPVCVATILGKGFDGYVEAMDLLIGRRKIPREP